MVVDDAALRRAIFEHAHDAMLLIDDDAVVLDANQAASELFARPRAEVLGRVTSSFTPEADRELCKAGLLAMRRDGAARGEVRICRPDETMRLVEFVLTGNVVPGRHLSVLRDVTERNARETEAARYRVLWQRARDIVLFIGPDGRLLDANDAALEAYGFSHDELLTKSIEDLRAPETRTAVPAQIEEAFERGLLFETMHVRRDGSRMPVEVGSRAAMINGQTVLLSVIRDISERKEMGARIAQADRLASVGTLAAGVAHEINNPLTYAMASVEMAHRVVARAREPAAAVASTEALARVAELLTTAMHGTDRVRSIVRDLMTLARSDDDVAAVDVRTVLDSCLDVAQHELQGDVRVVRAYAEVPPVRANEGRLAQVFLNLIVNAAQAIRGDREAEGGTRQGGTVRVETGVDDRGRVVVRVADDGRGVPPELLARIFDAFVTTKRAGKGTGLGLYLSRTILSALDGTIEVESELGKGTRFTVSLPATFARDRAGLRQSQRVRARRSRVMLVDDEVAIGRVLGAAIEDEHDVVVVTSGESAVERLSEDARFDVVVTDVSMPGMSGIDLLEHVRLQHPKLAKSVVLMTGGAARGRADVAAIAGVPMLEKPFSVDTLREAIARALLA